MLFFREWNRLYVSRMQQVAAELIIPFGTMFLFLFNLFIVVANVIYRDRKIAFNPFRSPNTDRNVFPTPETKQKKEHHNASFMCFNL